MPLNHGSSHPSATTTLIQRLKVIMNALHFLFKEEKDEETAFAVSFWNQMGSQSVLYFQDSSTYLGSFPGKQPNIERNYYQIHHFYMMKYFWPRDIALPGCDAKEPQQCESSFERRFRMPRMVFANILEGFLVDSDYIRKGMRPNAVGKLGISPLFKVICALKQISHDIPSDLAIDMFDASETTASLCLDEFCKAVEFRYRTKYLQDPTDEDFIRIERQFARVGFPGCIGCVDCGGWEWQSCPKALQGVMIGKEGKPTLRMELICDLDMWIWAAQFGLPGGFNDLNVREVSTHFNKILAGSLPTVKPSYTVGGIGIDWYYYLADGIYPKWKIFIQTIGQPLTKRKQLFSGRQEAVLKVVERAFGVVFKRFKSLFVKTQNFNVEKIRTMATAAIIMHNMIVVEQNPEAGSTLKVFETSLPMGWCLS